MTFDQILTMRGREAVEETRTLIESVRQGRDRLLLLRAELKAREEAHAPVVHVRGPITIADLEEILPTMVNDWIYLATDTLRVADEVAAALELRNQLLSNDDWNDDVQLRMRSHSAGRAKK